jgi:hypothetical protein
MAFDTETSRAGLMLQTDCSSCGARIREGSRFCRMCGTRLRPGAAQESERPKAAAASIEEIAFDDVEASDRILIQTENTEYRFSVVDPENRRGVLSGGSFGDGSKDATLVGVLIGGRAGHSSDTSRLKVDARALFYINGGAGLKRMTTSAITSLVHIRGDRAGRNRLR